MIWKLGKAFAVSSVILMLLVFFGLSFASNPAGAQYKSLFENYGCSGCHMAQNSTAGPSLKMIAALAHTHPKAWVISWILNPKAHYNDPQIKGLIKQYNQYMPNNGVKPADAQKLYDYLMSIR